MAERGNSPILSIHGHGPGDTTTGCGWLWLSMARGRWAASLGSRAVLGGKQVSAVPPVVSSEMGDRTGACTGVIEYVFPRAPAFSFHLGPSGRWRRVYLYIHISRVSIFGTVKSWQGC